MKFNLGIELDKSASWTEITNLGIGSMLSQFFQDVRTRVGRDVEVIGESCSESTWARERMLLGRILYKKKKGK